MRRDYADDHKLTVSWHQNLAHNNKDSISEGRIKPIHINIANFLLSHKDKCIKNY